MLALAFAALASASRAQPPRAVGAGSALSGRSGVEIAKRMAESGNPEGMYRLGRFYEKGGEVPRDPAEALRLYERAAGLGHAEAQFASGLFRTGAVRGAARDPVQSARWFEKAAMQGHLSAQYFLGLVYEAGEGVEASYELAFEWFRRAAAKGDTRAMNRLAGLYAEGRGVRFDLVSAHAWYRVAEGLGSGEAPALAAALEVTMPPEQLEEARERARTLQARYAETAP